MLQAAQWIFLVTVYASAGFILWEHSHAQLVDEVRLRLSGALLGGTKTGHF